ncbi:MAG TPA: hypothetical protein VIL16_12545 [Trebonia sp.]
MGFGQLPPPAWANKAARVYRVHMPHDLLIKVACEDAGCDQWRSGWETVCDESTKQGALVAAWIRSGQSGRTYRELAAVRGQPSVFRFDSGQRCFAEHRTRPGRLLVHQGGRPAREHASLADLAEDYTEHVGRVAEQQERG